MMLSLEEQYDDLLTEWRILVEALKIIRDLDKSVPVGVASILAREALEKVGEG